MERSPTKKLNAAINKLKNDLIEMRSQDVQLMKQLLHIDVEIQKLTNVRLSQSMRPCKRRRLSTQRQQSLPPYVWLHRDSLESSSSTDDYYEETSDLSEAEDDLFSKSTSYTRRRSIISIHPTTDDEIDENSDEDILRTNIKLWKYSKECEKSHRHSESES